MKHRILPRAVSAALLAGAMPVLADENIDAIRAELDALKLQYESRIQALEQRLQNAEQQLSSQQQAAVPVASFGQMRSGMGIGLRFPGNAGRRFGYVSIRILCRHHRIRPWTGCDRGQPPRRRRHAHLSR